jgi:hypothetical protein
MTDLDSFVRDFLERETPLRHERSPDWPEVLRRVEVAPAVRRRYLVVALALTATAVAVASALAATGTDPFGAIGSWLSGGPGKPAPGTAQQQFEAANGRTWAAFPTSTRLRELIRANVGRQRYVLDGFRSGDSFCLRLRAVTLRSNLAPKCTPVSALRQVNAPVLVVDGNDSVWAFPERRSPHVSFGIAADGVTQVEVNAIDGTHRARLADNVYLWVETEPNTGNRVLSVSAFTRDGRKTTTPVASQWFDGYRTSPVPAPRGPSHVQVALAHPTVAWIAKHEARGTAPGRAKLTAEQRRAVFPAGFVRLVKPDPSGDVVVVVSDWCLAVIEGGGPWASSGCTSKSDFFARGPLHFMGAIGSEFTRFTGVAADGVERITAFLGDGQKVNAALRDNVFTVLAPSHPPLRLVSYDAAGRVVGVQDLPTPFGRTAPREATRNLRTVLQLRGPDGISVTVKAGPTVQRSRCWRIDFSSGQTRETCEQYGVPTGPWISVDYVQPAGTDVFVIGRYHAPVVRAVLRFANGDAVSARSAAGLIVVAVPRSHLSRNRQRAVLTGYDAAGHEIQHPAVFFRANRG